MSVATTADDRIRDAKTHVGRAVEALKDIVVDECWGHDEFSKEFTKTIDDTFQQLLQIRRKLNG